MKLLVVDDEYYNVEGICRKLERAELGLDGLYRAYSLAEATQILLDVPIDVMITDIQMPKGSGLELVRWVREHRSSVVCVFLTAFATYEYASAALRLQGFDYLLKPVEEERLIQCVRDAMRRAEAADPDAQRAYVNVGPLPPAEPAEEEAPAPRPDAVETVCRYIREHIADDLTRDSLAARAYISPHYLSHLFRERTGRTLSDYILQQRVLHAKQLLLSSGMSIRDVALQSGFQSISYFAKQFRRLVGKTPRAYRRDG